MSYQGWKNYDSSAKYGPCEVCGEHASDVQHQIEKRKYSGGWTHHDCTDLFGHEACLQSKQHLQEGQG